MKIVIYLLLLLPFDFFSQQLEEKFLIANIKPLQHKTVDWTLLEEKLSLTEKTKLLTSVYNDNTETYCKGNNITSVDDFLRNYSTVFHFIDIDNDADMDVIFSGFECPGAGAGMVNIYFNKTKKLKKAISLPGKIVDFEKNKSIIIYSAPCCAMTNNTINYYNILGDSLDILSSVSFNTYTLSKTKTKILPSGLKAGQKIRLKYSTSVKLAATDSIFENAIGIKTVEIAKAKDLAEAKIYKTYTDKAKQKWLFVKLAYADLIPNESLKKVNPRNAVVLGWIKSPEQ